MPDTLNDNILDRAGLESIKPQGSIPRIVDEGGQDVWLRALIDGPHGKVDCEVRLTPGVLGNLLKDGLAAYVRMARE